MLAHKILNLITSPKTFHIMSHSQVPQVWTQKYVFGGHHSTPYRWNDFLDLVMKECGSQNGPHFCSLLDCCLQVQLASHSMRQPYREKPSTADSEADHPWLSCEMTVASADSLTATSEMISDDLIFKNLTGLRE